jgi:ElaB/YqjD/DUF883 family membrane-anchored ribosome-binding protein
MMDNRSTSGASLLEENLRGSIASAGASVSDSVASSRDAIGAAATGAVDAAKKDEQALQTDFDRLKDTMSTIMAQVTQEAAKSAREVSSNVVGRVGDVADDIARRGSAMASSATEQAKSFASELESLVRRNPMGAVAGAVMAGILIGVLGRRRG